MPFPNKGQNHINGIKNEKGIVDYLNKTPDNPITKSLEKENMDSIECWKHEGGTKQKRDASFKFGNGKTGGISIKNHDKGTFDYENTTKGVPEDLKKIIKEFKDKNMDKSIPNKGGVRDEVDNIFSLYLDNISSDEITELLDKIYQKEEDTRHIIINDKKMNRLILLDKSNLDPYFNSNNHHNFILKSTSRAKTSRQIWIKSSDGNEINTNLRIRLHLNNGITALLGKSKSNKNSVPCLKIQQDNVDGFISKCSGKVIADY
jgi:hypothetical protein